MAHAPKRRACQLLAAERRQEQEVRRKARKQAAGEREQELRARAALREIASRPRRVRSDHAAWLDERDAREPLTRADRHSWNDETAARVVDAGGGMQDVIEANRLAHPRERPRPDRPGDPHASARQRRARAGAASAALGSRPGSVRGSNHASGASDHRSRSSLGRCRLSARSRHRVCQRRRPSRGR